MASTFSLVFTAADGETPAGSDAGLTALRMRNWFHERLGRNGQGTDTLKVRTAGVAASGTVTCGTSVDADDTVTIGGIALTAKASGAVADQWNLSANATTCATNLAAAINASTTVGLVGCVSATSDGAVVTITATQPGKIGNAITLASSDGVDLVVSGARLASGAETLSTLSY